VALERRRISEDGFEGLMLLIAASSLYDEYVMDEPRCAPPKKRNRVKVETYAEKAGSGGLGIFLFVFLNGVARRRGLALF